MSDAASPPGPADFVPRERVLATLQRIPDDDWRALDAAVRAAGAARDVIFYPDDRAKRYIQIALRPWIFTPTQREYFRAVYLHIEQASLRLYSLAREDAEIDRLLPLTAEERPWYERAFPGGRIPHQTLFGRIDATVDPGRPDWRDTYQVIETNLAGIGATYYSYAAGGIARDLLAPAVRRADPGLALSFADDVLSLILHQLLDHARALGLPRCRIGLMQDESTLAGPYEFPTIAGLWRNQGYTVSVVDPRALRVVGGELRAGDDAFDLLYRDPTLENLLDMERDGGDLSAVRFAFEQNRVVSGLLGEFDHKGALEVLTSERMAPLLSPEQRASFRRHLPWTRVLRDLKTADPGGRTVDLFEFVRGARERLVLKPNRDYGGAGVVLGTETTQSEWERRVAEAFATPYRTVAQAAVPTYSDLYPVVADGAVEWRPFFNIYGFSGTPRGMATLGRMARGRIINITRDGGVVGVLSTA
ncbi:MAG: hypothetical protein HZA54_00790 [Planctomycetes bacterium]|nr:hypothetical protein [Planctomycetota bacterium]